MRNEEPKPFVWTATVESIKPNFSLPPDPGAESNRMYETANKKEAE